MINVILRFDDPSATSNHQLEEHIIDCLMANDFKATFAVIPFIKSETEYDYSDSSWVQHLIKAQGSGHVEIALHGFSHERHGCTHQGAPTEFSRVDADTQEKMIREGAEHLRKFFGNSVTGFIPPWNTYDENTLQVLEKLGFTYVSAGWSHPSKSKSNLALEPRTCQFSEIKEAIREARRYSRLNPKVIAVMHHYNFIESGESNAAFSLAEFHDLLAWTKSQLDLSVRTLSEQADLDLPQANSKKHHWQLSETQPNWRIQKYLPRHCLVDASLWRTLVTRMIMPCNT